MGPIGGNMQKIVGLLGIWGTWAFAAPLLVETGQPVSVLQENGVRVPVHNEATLTLAGADYSLYLTGAGLRKKRLGFANVSGYFALSYTDNPQGIDVQDPLGSVKQSRAKAVALVAVRLLTSYQVRNEIEDALLANNVDTEEADVDAILSRLNFNIPKGTRVVVASLQKGSVEGVWVEFPQDTLMSEGPDLAQRFWSGWFGIPLDAGMRELKESLMGKAEVQWPYDEVLKIAHKPKFLPEQ